MPRAKRAAKSDRAEPTYAIGLMAVCEDDGDVQAAVRVGNTLTRAELAEFKANRAELRAALAEEQLASVLWDVASNNRMMDDVRLKTARIRAENTMRSHMSQIRETFALGEGNFDVDVTTGTITSNTPSNKEE